MVSMREGFARVGTVLLLCAALSVHASDVADRLDAEAAALVDASDFAAIDARWSALLESGERTPGGASMAGRFAGGVRLAFERGAKSPAEFEAARARVARWTSGSPTSAAAHATMAWVLIDRAWAIRGNGYADTVPAEAWAGFNEAMAEASAYLEAHREPGRRDPEYYEATFNVARAQGWPKDRVRAAYLEAIAAFPSHVGIPLAFVESVTPKWGGTFDAVDAFAREVEARTSATDGHSMYARLYWSLAQSNDTGRMRSAPAFDWPHLTESFRDLVARYPTDYNVQGFAYFACLLSDAAVARELLPRFRYTEDNLNPKWPDICRASLDDWDRLAAERDARRAGYAAAPVPPAPPLTLRGLWYQYGTAFTVGAFALLLVVASVLRARSRRRSSRDHEAR